MFLAVSIQRLWRYLTAPSFNATTSTETDGSGVVTVTAGQRTRICTIKLSLAAEGTFANRHEEIDFPRPSIKSIPVLQVSYGEDRRPSRDVLELDVYVHITSVGKYSITPEFPEDRYNFIDIDKSPVHFCVKPSELKFVKLKSITPVPGHGEADSLYRGGTVEIRVTPEDKFGNFISTDADLKLNILPSSSLIVTLMSVAPNTWDQTFGVKIRCDNVGRGSLSLIVSQGNRHQVRKDIRLEVIPPPVSAAKSYIIQSDIDEIQERIYEAEQAITFRLALIDILGNPIPSEESVQYQDQFRLHHRRAISPNWSCATENGRSLDIRLSQVDSNICELEFTPSETGKGMYSLSTAGKMLSKSIPIAVLPRQADAQVIQNKNAYIDRERSDNQIRKKIPYNSEEYLEFYKCDQKILCLGVRRRDLVANTKNINRVLEKEYPSCLLSNDLVSRKYGLLVVFDLSTFQKDAALKVLELLSNLVAGQHHYRNEAKEFGNEKEKWKNRATEAYFAKEHQEAKQCKANKEKYGDLMNESHRRASDAIFNFYNYGRPQSQIDLHGQLVGNTEKSNAYKKQLLSKGDKTIAQVDSIIERERQESDEAIRKLDERLRNFDHEKAKQDGEDWLEIIDGAGHHSETKGKQKIRPKVKEYLGKKDIKYVEANEGALLITSSEYTGKEPCVADFYCTGCKKTWTSKNSWKGLFQMCSRCHNDGTISNCYPFKLRSVLPERRGQNIDQFKDHRRFCQKCIQLGQDCRGQR